MKKIISACAALLGTSLLAATVSDVVVRQRWPYANLVDVYYTLSGSDGPCDIEVTVSAEGGSVVLQDGALTGDLRDVEPGFRRLTFDPSRSGIAGLTSASDFSVSLAVRPTRIYMIVDLNPALDNTVAARITYTNEIIGANGEWSDYCKTNCVVLRRVKVGSFQIGATTSDSNYSYEYSVSGGGARRTVNLTHDYYLGVFEVPQQIFKNIESSYPFVQDKTFAAAADFAFRPANCVSYSDIRGSTAWPGTTGAPTAENLKSIRVVGANSWLAKFRAKTGGLYFDLPTCAQWERAYYADQVTHSSYYNGYNNPSPGGRGDNVYESHLGEIARYCFNSSWRTAQRLSDGIVANSVVASDIAYTTLSATEGGTARIGSYKPNSWGFYDMSGNVKELVTDYYKGLYDALNARAVDGVVTNFLGPTTGSSGYRAVRGGSWKTDANRCAGTSTFPGIGNSAREDDCGFRLCLTIDELDVAPDPFCAEVAGNAAVASPTGIAADCATNETVRFSTVRSIPVTLQLAYPPSATRAVLTFTSLMGEKVTVEIADGSPSYSWTPPVREDDGQGDLYDVAVEYFNGLTPVSAEVARLAVPRGLFSASPLRLDMSAPEWGRFVSRALLLPFDDAWAPDRAATTNAAVTTIIQESAFATESSRGSGWHGFSLKKPFVPGVIRVELAWDELNVFTANLQRLPAGMIITVR